VMMAVNEFVLVGHYDENEVRIRLELSMLTSGLNG